MKEYKISINGNEYKVAINDVEDNVAKVSVNGVEYVANVEGLNQRPKAVKRVKPAIPAAQTAQPTVVKVSSPKASTGGSAIQAPLPGTILEISVRIGDTVAEGQKLMVLEAMKMENIIEADKAGEVKDIAVNRGDSVLEGDVLITIG
ncbi:MAG: biotin/lipoyl-containing protein [Rikenellaceae bacterium]